MRQTRLILVEGIPGSGKSTLAHHLARRLADRGVPVRWWYEEEAGHPVYLFRDLTSLRGVVDDLARGEYSRVVAAALEQWRRFAAALADSETVVLLDGCLFGYLTWSLFPFEAPEAAIRAYVAEIERVIAPVRPCLIYLRQRDIAASLERLCRRRGGDAERRLVERSTQSPYGRRRGLAGFAGLVTYWTAYRDLTDAMYDAITLPKLAIETDAADWSGHQWRALAFLDLPPGDDKRLPVEAPERYVGDYHYAEGDNEGTATVGLDEGGLYLDGAPQVWPRNRLLPKTRDTFYVESLPFEVHFEVAGDGTIGRMVATGPELLGGRPPEVFVKAPGSVSSGAPGADGAGESL